ncbi:DNA-directed RNA polymerase II subunit [Malassezia obtusa]|uniref:DNA-directed RNA polymerase II subunit n=1 Tax=Malassezia obtusa TaxID=76774 RepID=A0AAF0E121_9BASI|nr:DNA-directed RNA polymerase II subunit [Malassezia obtusa]
MFFLVRARLTQKNLDHRTELHPSFYGPSMIEFLSRKLKDDVEGTCTGKYGYIIKVVSIMDVGQGRVMPGTGLAEFRSKYQAIVLKPFNGEVMDARVTNVNKMGFFAEVGPLSIFVSSHLLPIDYKFQPDANPPEFVSPSDFAIGTMKEDYLGPFD